MRVALFTDTYLPTVNGVARALSFLVARAKEVGHEVALISPPLAAPVDGVALHQVIAAPRFPLYPELHAAPPLLQRDARRRLEAFAPDVVHAATEAGVGLAGRRWALSAGVPLVTSFNTLFPEYLAGYGLGVLRGALWRYLRWFHDGADFTVTPSDWMRRELEHLGFHRRMALWSRGVDAELFHPGRRSWPLRRQLAPEADVILLYVGRMAREKKVELLLEAFPEIQSRTKRRVGLLMVGGGPALDFLRARAPEGVTFVGYKSGLELAAHYASADVFVFPSDTETFGQVVSEAHASGLPAVVPDRGGVIDLVQPCRTGFRFAPGDAMSLARAAARLVDDPPLRIRMGGIARGDAEDRSWPVVSGELIERFEMLAGLRAEPDPCDLLVEAR